MSTVSKYEPLKHYHWGDGCDGWVLVDTEQLSVKQERMPDGAEEILHYHEFAQQFFYILEGMASFEIEKKIITVKAGNGILVEAGKRHRIMNHSGEAIEFILSSQPSANNDRFNCI